MRKVNLIVVHCTATPEGRDVTVADIDRMHRAKGWKCIGYHYVVYRDGSVHEGRPVAEVGAHVYGHNINGNKVEESLKDIAIYSVIELYMVEKQKQEMAKAERAMLDKADAIRREILNLEVQ